MIHFKNHNPGVSFIEVMVALVLVSLVIVASFKTQGILLRTTAQTVNHVQAVAAIKSYFMQATQEKFIEKEGKQEAARLPSTQAYLRGYPCKRCIGI